MPSEIDLHNLELGCQRINELLPVGFNRPEESMQQQN
jgi:hypothetical protein